MKNIFGLRFRRRKLVASFSIALTFLMAGATVFQAAAAEPVNREAAPRRRTRRSHRRLDRPNGMPSTTPVVT